MLSLKPCWVNRDNIRSALSAPGILAEHLERAEELRELRVVEAAVAVFARDQLEQRHPHAVLGRDLVRALVGRILPEMERETLWGDCTFEVKSEVTRSNLRSKWRSNRRSNLVQPTKTSIRCTTCTLWGVHWVSMFCCIYFRCSSYRLGWTVAAGGTCPKCYTYKIYK